MDICVETFDYRKEREMNMKKNFRRVAAVLVLAVMMMALLTGCGAKGEVKKTISNFETACNSLDVRAMLECVNPTLSKPILAAMDLFGMEDTSGALDELVGLLGIFPGAGDKTAEFVKAVKIKPVDFTFNEDNDECIVVAELSYGLGKTENIAMEMVLKNEVWYISGINF